MKTLPILLIIASLSTSFAATPEKKTTESKAPAAKTKTASTKTTPKASTKGSAKQTAAKPKAPASPEKPKAPLSPEQAIFAKLTDDERLRLQVFLDREQFGPGKVDGMTGEFTIKAAARWMKAGKGRTLDSLLQAASEMPFSSTVNFTIPAAAEKYVGVVPATLDEKAAAKNLLYTSLAEYLTERFHTDGSALARLNPSLNIEKLKTGDTVAVPNVTPFQIESPRLDPKAATLAGAKITILHDEHMLEIRNSEDALVAAFPITVGNKPEHLRSGVWKVKAIAPNPTFTWDDSMLKNGVAGDKQYLLPPGPNNPVGVLWFELQPLKGPVAHIGIHGTSDPTHIGRNHSSGCIRLANWDVVRLAKIIGPGTKVAWVGGMHPVLIAKTNP